MSKFKVGDRVKIISERDSNGECWTGFELGNIGTVTKMYDKDERNDVIYFLDNNRYSTNFTENMLELVKEAKPMSRYSELKARIEALNNGWTKEADILFEEICKEFPGKERWIDLRIERCGGGKEGWIQVNTCKDGNSDTFYYKTSCEKNSAFKKALLWLLDHSDIKKDDHSEEIKSLREDIKKIEDRIKELEQ